MKQEQVVSEMKNLGTFSEEELSLITQDVIDDGVKNAEWLPVGNWPEDARPMGSWWSGNHFRIVSGIWYWDDKVGSQCGRDRTWKYKPSPGASYQRENKCPQGYYWYKMWIP